MVSFEKKNQKALVRWHAGIRSAWDQFGKTALLLLFKEESRFVMRLWLFLGSLFGLLAVACGALAAHAVPPDRSALAQSAVQLQGWHAVALLATALWCPRGGRWADAAGVAFVVGTLLFAGGLWSKALDGPPILFLAPWGGSTLMLGWALLAISALRAR